MNKKLLFLTLFVAIISMVSLTSCDDDYNDPAYDNPYIGTYYDRYSDETWVFTNNYAGNGVFEGYINGPGYTDWFNYWYGPGNRLTINYNNSATNFVYTTSWDNWGLYLTNYDGTIYLEYVY